MSIMSKRKIKQKTRHETRNKQIRRDLKRSLNRSYYQIIKIKRKELDTGDKELIQQDNTFQDGKRNTKD